ncbi:Early growth response protein 1 [Trichinella papuae]|uniref:Early growth response protein 1 n=1 Tax=Trichinella papuae TaxID=268474 RepID=A0A0V1N2K2_9BILA|nr:Early growth response protein 1 [Trichinella papuae]
MKNVQRHRWLCCSSSSSKLGEPGRGSQLGLAETSPASPAKTVATVCKACLPELKLKSMSTAERSVRGTSSTVALKMPEVVVDVPEPPSSVESPDPPSPVVNDNKSDLLSVYSSSGYASSLCSSVNNSSWTVFREKKSSNSDLTDPDSDYKEDLPSPCLTFSPGPVSPFSDVDQFESTAGADRSRFSFDHAKTAALRGRSLSDSDCFVSGATSMAETSPGQNARKKKQQQQQQQQHHQHHQQQHQRQQHQQQQQQQRHRQQRSHYASGTSLEPGPSCDRNYHEERKLPVEATPTHGTMLLAQTLSQRSSLTGYRFSFPSLFSPMSAAGVRIGGLPLQACFQAPAPPMTLTAPPVHVIAGIGDQFGPVAFYPARALAASPQPPPANKHDHCELVNSTPSCAYSCSICCQEFKSRARYLKHMEKSHQANSAGGSNEPPKPPKPTRTKSHLCSVCQKTFSRSDMLTRHMRLHTGVKPYSCRTCGQLFSRSDHLSTHKRTHTGEKPYQCPVCPYAASRRDLITRHARTHNNPTRGSHNQRVNRRPRSGPANPADEPAPAVVPVAAAAVDDALNPAVEPTAGQVSNPANAQVLSLMDPRLRSLFYYPSPEATYNFLAPVPLTVHSLSPVEHGITTLASSISAINVRSPRPEATPEGATASSPAAADEQDQLLLPP